jgi:hypothetical protein
VPEITTRLITAFTAFHGGREKGIDLDRDTLVRDFKIKADSTRWQVKASEEFVGVVEGKLFKWWEEAGHPGGTKLHWVCPGCGREDWGDWTPGVSNPCLWYSNCPCIGKWLICRDGNARPEGSASGGYEIVIL